MDGTGCAVFGADVRVRAGLIVEVGSDLAPDGERELDACGAVVAPGFIDTHTHLDPALFWDPRCDPMPQHGVTTVVTGNCSLSLAPVVAERRVELASLFSYIEDLPQSVLARSVPWTWTSWPEYRQVLQRRMFGVNVAALVGHTPLRMFVMGSQAWAGGARIYPQVSPRRVDVRINWNGGMAFYSMPPWHQALQATTSGKQVLLADPRWRQDARAAWDSMSRTLLRHKELDRIRLVSVTRRQNSRWVGSTLADLVTARNGHPSDVLADWVLDNDGDPGVVALGVANADPEGVAELLRHPATLVSNSDAGHMCT